MFTGSGSEADALAIRGAVLAARPGGRRHVITQVSEHPAVLAACRARGAARCRRDLPGRGQVDPAGALTPDTVLVSVMHANNETGTIQPIARIARTTKSAGVLLHVDAAQSAGKIDIDVDALGVDLLTVVGHKMYAEKGIGALYVRPGVRIRALIGGGGRLRAGAERGVRRRLRRSSSPGCPLLAAGESRRQLALRDQLEHRLATLLPGRVHLNGHPVQRLPNTANLRIDDAPALALLAGPDRRPSSRPGRLPPAGRTLSRAHRHGPVRRRRSDRDPSVPRPLDHRQVDAACTHLAGRPGPTTPDPRPTDTTQERP